MSFAGKFLVKHLQSIILAGEPLAAAVAGTSADILVLERDGNNYIRRAEGTDVPADDTNGYSKGCLFVDTNVAAATTGLYVNIGDTDDANFDAVSDA